MSLSVITNMDGHYHLLGYSCYHKRRLFRHRDLFQSFEESLARTLNHLSADCLAYIIMPSHVHLVVNLPDRISVTDFSRSLKRPFSFQAIRWLEEHEPAIIGWLTVKHGERTVRRFWQAGGGYDRVIDSEEGLREVVHYVHENPVRAGLAVEAKEWEWSSAKYYADGTKGVVPVLRPEWF